MHDAEQFLTSAQVAEQFQCSQRTVARWADSGRLPIAAYANGTRLFRQSDVDRVRAAELERAEARAAALRGDAA